MGLCEPATTSSCQIYLFSDLEDTRIINAPDVATAIAQLQPFMPDLARVDSITVAGLGASGANNDVVARVKATWEALLKNAKSTRIVRSI